MSVKDNKGGNLPLDAKLLSDAVIELNISRRSVSLYPPDHPIVEESLKKAFAYLQQLFELRAEITLGVAKDALFVDEYQLDRRNPVFKEFSLSLHAKALAAVKFRKGLSQNELLAFHSLITRDDALVGKTLITASKSGNMPHIELTPIDFSMFGFVESEQRADGTAGEVWHEYIYRLLEGNLPEGSEDMVLEVPPSQLSSAVNSAAIDETAGAYDRVITAYLKRQNQPRLSSESFSKFFSFIEQLKPEIKQQFMSRTTEHINANIKDIEAALADMTPEVFEQTAEEVVRKSSLIPETLQNLMAKFSGIKTGAGFQSGLSQTGNAQIHDIEFGDDVREIFEQDNFSSYVTEDYRKELNMMLAAPSAVNVESDMIRDGCSYEAIDKALLSVFFEILEDDCVTEDEYLELLTKLSDYVNSFLETGRFEEMLDVYNILSSQVFGGRYRDKASSMVNYFFRSEDLISRTVASLRMWGRKDREGAIRLAKALKLHIIAPLLDLIAEEKDAGMRKFFLSLLESIGGDVIPYAVQRLNDNRWYVVRNMLYLLRECNAVRQAAQVRKFIKDRNVIIRIEALSALLHFQTPDAVPFLKFYLNSEDAEMLKGAVRLAGKYRVVDAVPPLISLLEKKDFLGNTSAFKTDVIKALGEIGDARAISPLLNLYNAKTLLYRSFHEQLKVEIFRNIANYPPDALKPLIAAGLSSSNEEIQRIAETSSQEHQNPLPGGSGND